MSIQDRAILVKFSAGIGSSFRVTDKKASKEVQRSKGTTRAEVRKTLLPDGALDGLGNAIEAARDVHDEKTLPWSDMGDILRSDLFDEYTANMRKLRRAIDAEKEQFLQKYPEYVANAPDELGALYNPKDFKPVEKVAKRIYHEVKFLPIPAGQDFRLDLFQTSDEEKAAMRAQVDSQIRSTIFASFLDPIRNMVRRLGDPEGSFKNTLVGNLQELLKKVPPGDPEVDGLMKQVQALTEHDPESLRESPSLRRSTAAKANAILKNMAGYLPGGEAEVLADLPEVDPSALDQPETPQLDLAPEPAPEPEPEPVPVIETCFVQVAPDPEPVEESVKVAVLEPARTPSWRRRLVRA